MAYEFDLICIGSGPAGQRAAVQAAKLGKRVAVIERRRIVGGVCVDTGTIPSKTFREAVIVAVWPLAPSGRDFFTDVGPRLTMEQLLARIHHVMQREAEIIEKQLWRNDVALIRGHARFEDPHTLRVESELGQRVVTAEQVLIACGTRPAPPPSVATDGIVLTSDDILRLKRLPHTMAVIGGGVIGIEYASMFAATGVRVTVIERRERPLDFLDHEIVDELMHQMRNANVTFRLQEAVAKIESAGSRTPQAVIQHIGQAVMAFDGGLDYFLDTVFNYPTLAECYKVASLDAANKLQA